MNLKQTFSKWSAQVRALFAGVRKRPRGLMAMPGETATVRSGSLAMPVIRWDKFFRSPLFFNSLALVVCAYFVANLLVQAAQPWFPAPAAPQARLVGFGQSNTLERFAVIFNRNLFNKDGKIPDDQAAGIEGAPVRSSLPLTLLGLIVLSDAKLSVASIDDKGGNLVWAVREKENFSNGLTMEKIEAERVVFINRAERRREFIELPKDQLLTTRRAAPVNPGKSAGITNSGNDRYAIDRKEVDTMLAPENFNKILTQARCVPNFEAGKTAGYRCFQIEPGSIYDKLGMKDNDIICGINGQPVNNPADALGMLTNLKSSRNIEICINRNGQVKNMQYDIN